MKLRRPCLKFLAALALALVTQLGHADPASHRAVVEELMTHVRVENLMLGWRQQLDTQAIELINDVLAGRTEAQLSPAQKAVITTFSQKAKASLDDTLAWAKVRDAVAKIYMDRFTEDEIREVLAFYRSPIGRKWVGQTDQVSADIDAVIRARVQASVPEFKRLGTALRRDFAAAPAAAASTPAAPAPRPSSPQPPAQPDPAFNPKTGR